MSREVVKKMIDLWMNDPGFRAALRENAENTVHKMGFQLDEEEWKVIKNIDWKLSDEDLKSRISKGM